MNEQLSLFQLPPAAPLPKQRHIQLGAQVVSYVLKVGGRRRISMRIDERGLHVGSPHGVPLAEIEAFIRSHGRWVLEKLDEHVGGNARRQLAIRDGLHLPLLGERALVRVVAGNNRVRWIGEVLELAARPDANLDDLARKGLQRRALHLFGERLEHYARRMGRAAPPLGLSSARTRWGSCSLKSGIRINWRLIHLPLRLIDYVVVHELAHLKEMNHSPRFWAVVESLYADWHAARQELKMVASELPII